MATLSRVTKLTRAVLKWGAIFIVSLFILNILLKVGGKIKNSLFPPPPPAPTVAFGKLPAPAFPQSKLSGPFSYTVDTVSGTLPTFFPLMTIYKTVQREPALLSLQKARERVNRAGFSKEEKQHSNRIYQWSDDGGRTIKFDIISYDFDITSDYLSDPKILKAENLPNQDKARALATSFLEKLDLLPQDVGSESLKASFWGVKDNLLYPATSFSNAQIIRVDLLPKGVNDTPVVYPEKDSSLINFLIGGKVNEEGKVVEAHYFYRMPDQNNFSTYPIKSTDQALEELKNNEAYIVNVDNKKTTNINITKVSLGYYFSRETQDFFYPVFIFEGDNGFLAYTWAIDPSWIQQPN